MKPVATACDFRYCLHNLRLMQHFRTVLPLVRARPQISAALLEASFYISAVTQKKELI